VRARVLPRWANGPARLGEIIIALSTVVVVGEILGSAGWFRRWPLLIVTLAACGLEVYLSRRGAPRTRVTVTARSGLNGARRTPVFEIWALTIALAVVGAQWATKTVFAMRHGMTHPDTLWYHGAYTAQFYETGYLLRQLNPLDALHAYAGQTSELLHAYIAVLLGSDVFSPLVNLGWFAMVLLGAWCLGRRRGVGVLCMLGATLALGLPMIVATHPGQASNDVAAAALLLAAIALLLEGALALPPTAIAGLAAGLALSTKVTTGASVAVLSIGVLFIAGKRQRPRAAAGWWAGLVLTGIYWFIRNIKLAHNPLPFYHFKLGPLELKSALPRRGEALSQFLFNGQKWHALFLPGLRQGLGFLWPIVVAFAFAGAIFAIARGQSALERLVGIALLAGLIAYVFTPLTADGEGLAFKFNLRYITPSLTASVTALGLAFAYLSKRWRNVLSASFCAVTLLVVAVDAHSRNFERVPAWPPASKLVGPLVAALILGYTFVRLRGHRRLIDFVPMGWRRPVLAALGVAVLIIGYPVQSYALDHRYVHADLPLDPVNRAFVHIHDAKVAYFGTQESYPFYGTDLSNSVSYVLAPPGAATPQLCRIWLYVLSQYDYVVVTSEPYSFGVPPPEYALDRDPNVQRVAGDDLGKRVYKINGPLDKKLC
jgi:hypothetical protein